MSPIRKALSCPLRAGARPVRGARRQRPDRLREPRLREPDHRRQPRLPHRRRLGAGRAHVHRREEGRAQGPEPGRRGRRPGAGHHRHRRRRVGSWAARGGRGCLLRDQQLRLPPLHARHRAGQRRPGADGVAARPLHDHAGQRGDRQHRDPRHPRPRQRGLPRPEQHPRLHPVRQRDALDRERARGGRRHALGRLGRRRRLRRRRPTRLPHLRRAELRGQDHAREPRRARARGPPVLPGRRQPHPRLHEALRQGLPQPVPLPAAARRARRRGRGLEHARGARPAPLRPAGQELRLALLRGHDPDARLQGRPRVRRPSTPSRRAPTWARPTTTPRIRREPPMPGRSTRPRTTPSPIATSTSSATTRTGRSTWWRSTIRTR